MTAGVPVQTVKSNTTTTTIAETGVGNTLIVCINSYMTGGADITSVKLGLTPLDIAGGDTVGGLNYLNTYVYYLSDIAPGETEVIISGAVNVNAGNGGVCIYEVPGLFSVDAVDKSSNDGSGTADEAYSSGPTGGLSQEAEFIVGTGFAPLGGISNPSGGGWTNSTDDTSGDTEWVCSYQVVDSVETLTYEGTMSTAGPWTAVIVTFKIYAASASAAAGFFAFFP